MFQNQNLQITFLVLHLFDPKKMIFFIREQKISQENLKFRVLVMFSRKMNFSLIQRFLLVVGYLIELPQMTAKKFENGHEKTIFGQKCSKVQKKVSSHFFENFAVM